MKIENLITKCYDKQQRLFIHSFVRFSCTCVLTLSLDRRRMLLVDTRLGSSALVLGHN